MFILSPAEVDEGSSLCSVVKTAPLTINTETLCSSLIKCVLKFEFVNLFR